MNAEQRKEAEAYSCRLEQNGSLAARVGFVEADRLGSDQCLDIAALLRAGIAASERLEDIEADFRAVVNGECAPDEKHCSCVPHLKRALKQASEECERLRAHVCTDNRETLKNALAQVELLESRGRVLARIISNLTSQRQDAWLAAWDAEWRAQRSDARTDMWINTTAHVVAKDDLLRALLERAAGVLRESGDWVTHSAECGVTGCRQERFVRSRDALLADIEGAGK